MRRILLVLFILLYLGGVSYLLIPTPRFPEPLPDSLESSEPADTETPLRRAYFTNYSRDEVMKHYTEQFDTFLPSIRLNYPPEEAYIKIRDQTRSTFLEELVHPLRESIFINGFKPSTAKDEIWYKGEHFEQKITVSYYPSSVFVRVAVFTGSFFVVWMLYHIYADIFTHLPYILRKTLVAIGITRDVKKH